MPRREPGIFGWGSIWHQQENNKPDRCNSTTIPLCENDCCAIVSCKMCLTWTPYGGATRYGYMTYSAYDDKWVGSVAGLAVEGYWSRDYADDCAFFIEVGGYIVWQEKQCNLGASGDLACRNPAGETSYTIADKYYPVTGVLTWATEEYIKLARVLAEAATPYETAKCAKHYCGDCDCSCPKLCVHITVQDYYGGIPCTAQGIFDANSGNCGHQIPVWEGELLCGVDTYNLQVKLRPNIYDHSCELVFSDSSDNGYSFNELSYPQAVTDCNDLTASVTYTDYLGREITIRASCAECSECYISVDCCANPLPRTLYVDVEVFGSPGPNGDDCSCAEGAFELNWEYEHPSMIAAGWFAEVEWACPGEPATHIRYQLICIAGVWHLFVQGIVYDEYGNESVTFTHSMEAEPGGECEPFEQKFKPDDGQTPDGGLIFDGECIGGLVPDIGIFTVTL